MLTFPNLNQSGDFNFFVLSCQSEKFLLLLHLGSQTTYILCLKLNRLHGM